MANREVAEIEVDLNEHQLSSKQLALGLGSNPAESQEVPKPPTEEQLAPMMRHYLEVKRQYPEHLLLFQVGDFYEVFFEDAKIVADALNIRLTSRDKNNPNPVPMCGVPIHAIEGYLAKLVESGFSAVLISQMEEEKGKKGMVRREITRIVTPGVRFEGDGLDEKRFNYLLSAIYGPQGGAVSFIDVSTGNLRVQEFELLDELLETIERVRPSELIIPSAVELWPFDKNAKAYKEIRKLAGALGARIVNRPFFAIQGAVLREKLQGVVSGSCADASRISPEAALCVDCVLNYVDEVSCHRTPRLADFNVITRTQRVIIDAATRRNLEIFETKIDGEKKNSLFSILDRAETAMGSRQIGEWLLMPCSDIAEICARQDSIEELLKRPDQLKTIRSHLTGVRDIDRLLSRITSFRATPRDLLALAESLEALPEIKAELGLVSSSQLRGICALLDPLPEVSTKLQGAIVEDPPARVHEGGIFREGFNAELDELRRIRSEAHNLLAALEQRERAKSGIPSLKVRYNNVFGYSIEISKAHLGKVPDSFQRRQTLANAERFVTEELKELELKILSAKAKQIELERELFVELRASVAEEAPRIQVTSRQLSLLDALCALTQVALDYNYCRPQISANRRLYIKNGRHPVVERVIGEHNFIPNDTLLDGEKRRFAVLTGPNMGGKSTYLRQVGLIQLLAQTGSYVPAEKAELGIVDRIFTRIGAADDLTKGDSTFMVEMKEASTIVRKATPDSLVLIDEIGRGTATADGLAIATSVAEWLHDSVCCRTVFATHFHELTALASVKEGAFCLSVGVLEQGDQIEFTHRIEEKAGDRSYGIEVAKLAGLPEELINRAQELLIIPGENPPKPTVVHKETIVPAKLGLQNEIINELDSIEPDNLTPIEGLLYLGKLKKMTAKWRTE